MGQSSFFVLTIYCLGGVKKRLTFSWPQIGLNTNYLFRPIWAQEKVNLLLTSNWSKWKNLLWKRNVMIMRHKGGWGISPTALEHSDRHNLCRISRVSTGRLICKTKPLKNWSLQVVTISAWKNKLSQISLPVLTLLMGQKLCLWLCSSAVGGISQPP